MKYQIGDKVELKNGSIVIINKIVQTIDTIVYSYGNNPKVILPEDDIVCKVEKE